MLGCAVLGGQVAAGSDVAGPGLGGDAVRDGAGLQLGGGDVGAGMDLGDGLVDDPAERSAVGKPGAHQAVHPLYIG